MPTTDAAFQKNIYESGIATLIILNEEMENIIKIVKSLQESGLIIKAISETIKNEAKQQKGGFLPTLLRTLSATILGNVLIGKGVIRAGGGVMKAGQNF